MKADVPYGQMDNTPLRTWLNIYITCHTYTSQKYTFCCISALFVLIGIINESQFVISDLVKLVQLIHLISIWKLDSISPLQNVTALRMNVLSLFCFYRIPKPDKSNFRRFPFWYEVFLVMSWRWFVWRGMDQPFGWSDYVHTRVYRCQLILRVLHSGRASSSMKCILASDFSS